MGRPKRWQANPVRDLFDAALQHYNIGAVCRRCPHRSILSAAGLWYLFERRNWPDRIGEARRRLRCTSCGSRDAAIELVTGKPTLQSLELPDDREWKRAVSRRR